MRCDFYSHREKVWKDAEQNSGQSSENENRMKGIIKGNFCLVCILWIS